MILNGHRRVHRITAWTTLIMTLPMFLGLHPVIETTLWAQMPTLDTENAPYELNGSAELDDLAESLNYKPLEMFDWVRREVAFEPYGGSVKGRSGRGASNEGMRWTR